MSLLSFCHCKRAKDDCPSTFDWRTCLASFLFHTCWSLYCNIGIKYFSYLWRCRHEQYRWECENKAEYRVAPEIIEKNMKQFFYRYFSWGYQSEKAWYSYRDKPESISTRTKLWYWWTQVVKIVSGHWICHKSHFLSFAGPSKIVLCYCRSNILMGPTIICISDRNRYIPVN